MKVKVAFWWVLIVNILCGISANENYGKLRGHQIWKLEGKESSVPSQLMIDGLVDVLDHSGASRNVRIAPHHIQKVQNILRNEGLPYQVVVDDLASRFEAEDETERARRDIAAEDPESCTSSDCPKPLMDNYMRFNKMEWYLKQLNETYFPRVNLTSIGKSHEDRDIWLVHIKSTNDNAQSVWIEGGIHAREWISPAVSFGLLDKLVNDEYATTYFEFFVAPMVNPDGYEYTHTTDRYWRKNRRNNGGNTACAGVDLNRNWDYHYSVGASSQICSEVYKGPSAFSEPETQALRDAMTKEKDNLILVLALHSYGQDLLYPWGWSVTEDPPNKEQLIQTGQIFSNGAKEINGKNYKVVNSAGGMYFASGATDDWALGVLGTKYVYTLELRDDGYMGFRLSTGDIEPCTEEVWNGLMKLLEHIQES